MKAIECVLDYLVNTAVLGLALGGLGGLTLYATVDAFGFLSWREGGS